MEGWPDGFNSEKDTEGHASGPEFNSWISQGGRKEPDTHHTHIHIPHVFKISEEKVKGGP